MGKGIWRRIQESDTDFLVAFLPVPAIVSLDEIDYPLFLLRGPCSHLLSG